MRWWTPCATSRNCLRCRPRNRRSSTTGGRFFRTRRVSQATFDAARAEFGDRGLIELTNLMGYYSVLAFNINALRAAAAGVGRAVFCRCRGLAGVSNSRAG